MPTKSRRSSHSKGSKFERNQITRRKNDASEKVAPVSGAFPFYNDDKKNTYILGILPLAFFALWSIASEAFGSCNSYPQNQLQVLFDHVIQAGRKTIYYDDDFSFSIQNRTLVAERPIGKGSLILDISRDAQLWNVDAFQDPFIRRELFSTKHAMSGALVDHRAYLAAFLALHSPNHSSDGTTIEPVTTDPDVLQAFLAYLPTEQDYALHPVFQDPDQLAATFGEHSMAYNLIRRRQLEWESEYHSLCQQSAAFASRVSRLQDYMVARIHVVSRSLSATAVARESDLTVAGISQADLNMYSNDLGYDCTRDGFVTMVPMVDALDHRSVQESNVEYRYNPDSKSFSIFATRSIAPGAELTITYGEKVDQWLYANYGFVSTDGSGRSGATLAAFHTIHHESLVSPSTSDPDNELSLYLQYDDGFDHCIGADESDGELLTFKRMKLELLRSIANSPEKWMASLPQRNVGEYSSFSQDSSKRSDIVDREGGMMGILSTCRLLALIPEDYEGRASFVLKGLVQRYRSGVEDFRMIPGGRSLEYRARAWLKRLAHTKLDQYAACSTTPSTVAEEIEHMTSGASLSGVAGDNIVMEAHVRLSELQSLEFLVDYAEKYLQGTTGKGHGQAEFLIRDDRCPTELTKSL